LATVITAAASIAELTRARSAVPSSVNSVPDSAQTGTTSDSASGRMATPHGRVATAGPIASLKQPRGQVFELRVKAPEGTEWFVQRLRAEGLDCKATEEDVMRVFVPGEAGARELFALAASAHVQVRHLRPSVPTLEDVFAKAVGVE